MMPIQPRSDRQCSTGSSDVCSFKRLNLKPIRNQTVQVVSSNENEKPEGFIE